MNPVRGGGSASALTMTSWSALATTHPFGGVVVVGGAAQHAAALGDPHDPGERSGAPAVSPTSPTRSPTTTALRPSSRARIAVTTALVGALVDQAGVAGRGRR